MNLDLNKLTCGVSLTDTEQAVLEYLLLHLDEALKIFIHDGRISGKKAAGIGNQVHFF